MEIAIKLFRIERGKPIYLGEKSVPKEKYVKVKNGIDEQLRRISNIFDNYKAMEIIKSKSRPKNNKIQSHLNELIIARKTLISSRQKLVNFFD